MHRILQFVSYKKQISQECEPRGQWNISFDHTGLSTLLASFTRCPAFSGIHGGPISISSKTLAKSLLRDVNLKNLLKTSCPSPFGKGDKTLIDESVRLGSELDASSIVVELTKNNFRNKVQMALFPLTGISFKFYKLAFYGPEGEMN
jgi:hypothetical protein